VNSAHYFVLAAALAAAQAPPQAPAPHPSVDNVYWMVACLAGHGDHEMDRVLATVPGGDDSTVALFHAMAGDCLVAEHPLAGRDFFLRGAIAERLLYRDFEAIGMPPRHRATAVFAPLGRDQLARMSEAAHQLLAMLDIAACVARMEPAKVYAFFGTARGSAAERAAMTELAPAISACLFQGQTFNLTPPIFRAFLAEGAYRVAAGQTAVFRAGR
jgi:hypothetical protein